MPAKLDSVSIFNSIRVRPTAVMTFGSSLDVTKGYQAHFRLARVLVETSRQDYYPPERTGACVVTKEGRLIGCVACMGDPNKTTGVLSVACLSLLLLFGFIPIYLFLLALFVVFPRALFNRPVPVKGAFSPGAAVVQEAIDYVKTLATRRGKRLE